MNRAVFLDRDGTIIKDKGYLKYLKEVEFYKDTFESLEELHKYFLLFVVTNQPGIAKGLITSGEVENIHRFISEQLKNKGIIIKEFYYCPHLKEDHCYCRKPNPYFINLSAEKYSIDIADSFIIGDHPSDIQLASNSGAKGIYLLTGHGKKHVHELPDRFSEPIKICRSIKYATRHILDRIQ
jgi:D-glycero-D-manno-heptose 1,7-bisphosphate phosphatase